METKAINRTVWEGQASELSGSLTPHSAVLTPPPQKFLSPPHTLTRPGRAQFRQKEDRLVSKLLLCVWCHTEGIESGARALRAFTSALKFRHVSTCLRPTRISTAGEKALPKRKKQCLEPAISEEQPKNCPVTLLTESEQLRTERRAWDKLATQLWAPNATAELGKAFIFLGSKFPNSILCPLPLLKLSFQALSIASHPSSGSAGPTRMSFPSDCGAPEADCIHLQKEKARD